MSAIGRVLVGVAIGILLTTPLSARVRDERALRNPPRSPPVVPPQGAITPPKALSETYWFGGTHWNSTAGRWEANVSTDPQNAWTFDSGIDQNREGWTRFDFTADDPPSLPPGASDNADFRWVDQQKYNFYGTPGTDLFPGTGDNGGLWCGKFESEADALCWADGQGYGNDWDQEAQKTYAYGGTGDVRLTYRFFRNLESIYDNVKLYLEFNGVREANHRAFHTAGGTSIVKGTNTITLSATSIPPTTTAITTVFRFKSDVGVSDEDGVLNTIYSGFCLSQLQLRGSRHAGQR